MVWGSVFMTWQHDSKCSEFHLRMWHHFDKTMNIGIGNISKTFFLRMKKRFYKNELDMINTYLHVYIYLDIYTFRRTRHAGHCWRSKDELISDVLLWTLAYGQAKAGWPAWTYLQQLCEDTGCSPEDLPEAMNDREKWRERVRDIRASGMTWDIYIYIYIYIYI